MFENTHDDWCECWKSGATSPDYSKCDCHLLSIKRLQEIIERGKNANHKQEAEIQRLSIKFDLFKKAVEDFCKPNQFWEFKNGKWTIRSRHIEA